MVAFLAESVLVDSDALWDVLRRGCPRGILWHSTVLAGATGVFFALAPYRRFTCCLDIWWWACLACRFSNYLCISFNARFDCVWCTTNVCLARCISNIFSRRLTTGTFLDFLGFSFFHLTDGQNCCFMSSIVFSAGVSAVAPADKWNNCACNSSWWTLHFRTFCSACIWSSACSACSAYLACWAVSPSRSFLATQYLPSFFFWSSS